MKTLQKYQLNQNPKCTGTLPFRTETGLKILLICKKKSPEAVEEADKYDV